MTVDLVILVAVAEDGTIGDGGSIPWYHPEDLRHFKRTTMGSPVVLGRVTYESIVDRLGHALPGRASIVLTGREAEAVVDADHIPDDRTTVHVVDGVDAAIETAESFDTDAAFVAGGRSVYEQFLPIADAMLITEVPGTYGGDTTFPSWDPHDWREVDRDTADGLSFVRYRRRTDR